MERHKAVSITSPESSEPNAPDLYVKEVEAITKHGWRVYNVQRISSFYVYVFFKREE